MSAHALKSNKSNDNIPLENDEAVFVADKFANNVRRERRWRFEDPVTAVQ